MSACTTRDVLSEPALVGAGTCTVLLSALSRLVIIVVLRSEPAASTMNEGHDAARVVAVGDFDHQVAGVNPVTAPQFVRRLDCL